MTVNHTKPTPRAASPPGNVAAAIHEMHERESRRDGRVLRLALVFAALLHGTLLAVEAPWLQEKETPPPPEEEQVFVIQPVRLKPPEPEPPPPQEEPQPVPQPEARTVPVPDPTPDEPEPIPAPEPEPVPEVPVPEREVDLVVPPTPVEPTPVPTLEIEPTAVMEIPEAPAPPPPPPMPEGPIMVSGAVVAPVKVNAPLPVYPEAARKARVQGAVVVQATIDTSGNVTDVEVLKSLPMNLDDMAVQAVRRWKFKPATLHGKPVAVYYNLTVNFQIQ